MIPISYKEKVMDNLQIPQLSKIKVFNTLDWEYNLLMIKSNIRSLNIVVGCKTMTTLIDKTYDLIFWLSHSSSQSAL